MSRSEVVTGGDALGTIFSALFLLALYVGAALYTVVPRFDVSPAFLALPPIAGFVAAGVRLATGRRTLWTVKPDAERRSALLWGGVGVGLILAALVPDFLAGVGGSVMALGCGWLLAAVPAQWWSTRRLGSN